MITITKKDKRSVCMGIFFEGLLPPETLTSLVYAMDVWAETIIGARFGNNISCGLFSPYMKPQPKEQVGVYLPEIPPVQRHVSGLTNTGVFYDPFAYDIRHFSFSYMPCIAADWPDSMLNIDIEYLISFDFSPAQLITIMQEWGELLQKEGMKIKYGYIEPRTTTLLDRHDEGYTRTPIPGNKLMGVRWGNLLTKQHLGKHPAQLLAAINRVIAPEKIVPMAPDLYWFTLPFDLKGYSQAKHPEYLAMMHKTLEVIKPYKVLWRNGIRKYY